jgi:hypothetical protein
MLQFCRNTDFNAKNLDKFVEFTRDIWKSHPPEDDVTIVVLTWKPEEQTASNAA